MKITKKPCKHIVDDSVTYKHVSSSDKAMPSTAGPGIDISATRALSGI